MSTIQYKLVECQYTGCTKTFVQENLRKKFCSCSCRVRACNRRKKECRLGGQAVIAAPSSTGGVTFSDAQFQELKSLIQQCLQTEPKSDAALDLTRVVEAGLGTMAGNAIIGLMGKSSLEEKVDYLIRLIVPLVQQKGATVKMGTASPTVKQPGVVPLKTLGLQKTTQLNAKSKSSGFGMEPLML